MKYLSKESAVEGIRKIFGNSDKNSMTLDEVYSSWDRQNYSPLQNQHWIGNKMTHWKYYNLIKPIYGLRSGKRILKGLQLTLHGKELLDSPNAFDNLNQASSLDQNHHVSLAEVLETVRTLKKENPDYEIIFDVKLKNGK